MRRVTMLPSMNLRFTAVSLLGATGVWLAEELRLKRSEVIAGGRAFAHIHPDGSLHASVPPERARAAIVKGWAVSHPWAEKRASWAGFVVLFTPQTKEQQEVTSRLIVDGYNFFADKTLTASECR